MARARPFRSLSVSVLIVCALLALTALPTVAAAHSACSGGGAVELGVGFRDLADLLGALVGEPLECEHADASTGDVVQQTSTGLLYWRKSTNTPTFTNGDQHWALRGEQILQWSGDSVDPPDDAESPRAEAQAPMAAAEPTPLAAPTRVLAQAEPQLRAVVPAPTPQLVDPSKFYPYLILSVLVFLANLRSGHVGSMLVYFVLTTIAASALQYASPYVMSWDAHADPLGLFPIKVTNDARPPPNMIDKNSGEYWGLTLAFTATYFTFPQAVLNALPRGTQGLVNQVLWLLFKRAAQLGGIGLVFFTLVFGLSSAFSPYGNIQWLTFLGAFFSIVLILGNTFWDDVFSASVPQ